MAITQVGTAGSGTSTASPLSLTYPTGIQSGDIVVVVVEQRSGSGASITKPTGFTTILRTNATTSVGIESFRRVCDGSETGSTSWTLTGSGLTAAHISAWRGVDNTTPVDVSAGGTGNGTSVVAPDATTTTGSCLLLRAHGGRLNTGTGVSYTADGATTEKTDANAGTSPNVSLMVATETAGAAGAVGTRTATASASLTDFTAQTIALKPAGGTAFTQSLAGALTPAGAVAKSASKPLAGGATPTGTLAKAASKALVGGLTPAGALAKLVAKALGGGLTPSGALASLKVALLNLAGSITPSGAVTRTAAKGTGGTVAPSGGTSKAVSSSLTGSVTATGLLAKVTAKALGGGLTPSGALVKLASKLLAGVLTPSGSLATTITTGEPNMPATVGVTTTQPGTVGVTTTDPTTGATTTDHSNVGVSTFGGDP